MTCVKLNILRRFPPPRDRGARRSGGAGRPASRARSSPVSRSSRRAIRRMAISRPMPRWCWPAPKQNPMALAERIAEALSGRELESAGYRGSGFTVAAARPGFLNIRLDPAVWHAQLRAILRAGNGVRRHRSRRRRAGSMSSSSRPIRPGRCMSGTAAARWSATRSPRCWRRPGSPCIASITSTTPAPRSMSGAVGLSALPRGARRGGRRRSRRVLSRRIPGRRQAARWPNATATNGAAARGRWLAPVRDFAVAEMWRLIRADLAAARGRIRRLHLGARAGRERRGRCGARRAVRARADLRGRARAAEGQTARRLGAAPADAVPGDAIRRRGGPASEKIRRVLDLFRGRHRLSSRQGAARLHDLIDVWGADHGGYVKRMQAAVKAMSEGRAVLDVKLTQLVHLFDNGEPVRMSKRAGTFVTLARGRRRGRKGRVPLHDADPQKRPDARIRLREGHGAVEGQPGLLRAIRARPCRLGHASCVGAVRRGAS